ncbi:MAG: N-acetyltransferase [Caulobacteraceae bacterium]|nr:MAG: N-acetyltransferase [Caulobacteraceae bacterium]
MIRPAAPADHAAIHAVVAAAFGQAEEAQLVEALRADGDALLELVAADDGAVVGHILFSPLVTDNGRRLAALAPLSVEPGRQKTGLGTALMEEGHRRLAAAGIEAVILLGHPAYYPRVGYSADLAKVVTSPFNGPGFMALELAPGALSQPLGITYARAFGL